MQDIKQSSCVITSRDNTVRLLLKSLWISTLFYVLCFNVLWGSLLSSADVIWKCLFSSSSSPPFPLFFPPSFPLPSLPPFPHTFSPFLPTFNFSLPLPFLSSLPSFSFSLSPPFSFPLPPCSPFFFFCSTCAWFNIYWDLLNLLENYRN